MQQLISMKAKPRAYKTAAIIGGYQYEELYAQTLRKLSLSGRIPLAVQAHYGDAEIGGSEEDLMRNMRIEAVTIADEIYILNPCRESSDEIEQATALARKLKKPVIYLLNPEGQALNAAYG